MAVCPFCQIAAGEVDSDLVAYRSANVFVLPALTQRENNRGHVLVLPTAHVIELVGAPPGLLRELFDVVARVSRAALPAFGAVGTTIFQNNGAPDQILSHLHVHVVPRFANDDFRIPEPAISVIDPAIRAAQAAALARALLA